MSKLTIVPFEVDHISRMDLREHDSMVLSAAPDYAELSARMFAVNGFGYTALDAENHVVGAAGLVRIFPGTWEGWAYTTPLFQKYGIQVHRMAKRMLDEHFAQPDVRRIQCIVDAKYYDAMRWAEALGFKCESYLVSYGPEGQPYAMFAMVKKQ